MQSKKIVLILLFVFVLFLSFFGLNKNVYAADEDSLENWVSENGQTLYDTFIDYDYVVVNNVFENYVYIYYAPKGTIFEFAEVGNVDGTRRRVLTSYLENRDNHFDFKLLNPNKDNNFVVPSNLKSLEEFETYTLTNNNSIINDFELSNILYNSNSYIVDGTEYNDTFPFLCPLAETLATAVETAEPGIVLTEILKIIPLILVILVSFLGLRKVLRMLLMLLRRS